MSEILSVDSNDFPVIIWSELRPDSVALRTGKGSYTWRQVAQRVSSLAMSFSTFGILPGDLMVYVGKNDPNMIWCYLTAMHLGVTSSFIAQAPVEQIAGKLDTLSVPGQTIWIYVSDPHFQADVEGLCLHYPNLKIIPHCGLDHPLFDSGEVESDHDFHPDKLASLIFTSGSMGKPKAVAHTHRQHFASASGLLERFAYSRNNTWLLSLPLYHVSGVAIIYRWLMVGGCLKVGCGNLFDDIADVTHASLVPVQLQRLLDSQPPMTLTRVLLGGSHIPGELCERANQQGIETWLGYGMTESASTVTAKRYDGLEGTGYVLPRRQVKIENQHIFIAGETLALGYFYKGEITPLTDSDGWFDSKDLGCWDNDQIIVLGRADNMFISGGENIHCEEIESMLSLHAQIDFAVVVPVADKEYGARSVAVLYSHESLPSREEIEAWLTGRLEKFKWPIDYVELPEELIRQGIKLPRRVIKQWLLESGIHH